MRRFMAGLFMAALVGLLATGALADDQTIARTIVEKLQVEQQQGKLKGFNIGVRVDNGDVWIEGDVVNGDQQTLVLDVASRVNGVRQVVNGIKIVEPGQPAAPTATASTPPQRARSLFAGVGTPVRSALTEAARKTAAAPAAKPAEPQRPNLTTPTSLAQTEAPKPTAPPSLASVEPRLSTRLLGTPPESGPVMPKAVLPKPPVARPPQMAMAQPPVARPPQTVITEPPVARPPQTVMVEPPVARPPQAVMVERPVARPPQVDTGVVAASNARLAQLANTPSQPVAAPRMANQMPVAYAPARGVSLNQPVMGAAPVPAYVPGTGGGVAPARYDHPNMPGYAWPAYASYPNYAGLTYPKQYSPTAWPYIGPFYPYPQVPLGWRKVMLEWDDGWWMLDFKAK